MDTQRSYDTPGSLTEDTFPADQDNHGAASYASEAHSNGVIRGYRAMTPPAASLSSPPPTVIHGTGRDTVADTTSSKPTTSEIEQASKDELLAMLNIALSENDKLDTMAHEARMSAAHFKLQHNLLSIETEEVTKRMEVEHEMTKREVSWLQHVAYERPESTSPEFISKIREYCQALEQENMIVQRRLKHARKLLEDREDEIELLKERNEQFKQRIRENRQHINTLRSPGGIFHSASPKVHNQSYPATPQQYARSTPKHTPATDRSIRQPHSQEPFAALLLADRVLSQEHNSAPNTPTVGRRTQLPTTPITKQGRVSTDNMSLANTPQTARPGTSQSALLPSIQFTPQSSRSHRLKTPAKSTRERRRKSRDSTISASDDESYVDRNPEIQASRASQSATEMLRVDPSGSFEVNGSRNNTSTPITEKSSLLQSKILGSVTKSVAEKRKRISDVYPQDHHATKKAREDSSPGGLGIGAAAA